MTLVKVNSPISRSFDSMFKDFFQEFPSTISKAVRDEVFQFPPVNITENNDSYVADLAVPGFEKTDFKINVDGTLLTISGEKRDEKKEENEKSIRREYSYKSFQRTFTLNEQIDVTNITAAYENGILKVSMPKVEIAKPQTREISIK